MKQLALAEIREMVWSALDEDLGLDSIDITTEIAVEPGTLAQARIVAKQPGVLAGIVVAREVWREVDDELKIVVQAKDGDVIQAGQVVQEIHGEAASILIGERSALNFIQQLSGVATETRRYVDAVAGTKTQILDTRKTIPGMRALQKYAVRCGGGKNHRMGLYDQFLLKDNHLALFGRGKTLAQAVAEAREFQPQAILEVEADSMAQVQEIAPLGVDIILLDNMSNEEMAACVKFIDGRAKTEASGNMNLARVPAVAATGVDFISVGALTHTITALDFSLEIFSAG